MSELAQVVATFRRRVPTPDERLDDLADVCLSALNRDARFVAFGPVVSVDYSESKLEVEFTACTSGGTDDEVGEKIARVQELVQKALTAAEYATTTKRIAVPA